MKLLKIGYFYLTFRTDDYGFDVNLNTDLSCQHNCTHMACPKYRDTPFSYLDDDWEWTTTTADKEILEDILLYKSKHRIFSNLRIS